jgi:tetratricopeptide (TPR) repeat protein
MSKQIENSLFMLSPFGLEQTGFYQDLLRGISSYQQLGNRLIRLAEQAHAFRQFDKVKEIGQILSNFPIKSYQAIGYYYLAVSYNNCGSGDLEKAKELLTLAADTAPLRFRAKALLSLAAVSAHLKNPDAELYYFTETLKASSDIATSLIAYRGIAVHKAKEGYHKQALSDLENILPLARFVPPHIYFDYLNSLAVELGEANRKQEARNVSHVILASSLAQAYPEWRETAEELKPSRRSFMAMASSRFNVLTMPEREPNQQPTLQPKRAQVLNLAKWKKKMVKESDDNDKTSQSLEEMTPQDMAMKLLELITENRYEEDKIRKVLEHALEIFSEPRKPVS